jgi:hypothetical protein
MSEPIRIWSWQLDSMPQYRRLIGRGDRARMRLLRLALSGMELATDHGARHKTRLARTINRLAPLVRKHLCVDIPPAQLFGAEACEEQGTQDRLFFVASHDAPEVTVRTIDPGEIARRMVYSHQQEQMPLLSYYWKFRFAFPHLSNNLIENSRELQEESLTRVLEDKASFEVLHPHHVALPELYEAIRPYCV